MVNRFKKIFTLLPFCLWLAAASVLFSSCESGSVNELSKEVLDEEPKIEPPPFEEAKTDTATQQPEPQPPVVPPVEDAGELSLELYSGNAQTAEPGAAFNDPLTVRLVRIVKDTVKPVADEEVVFALSGGAGGTLSASTSKTDANGLSSVTLTGGQKPGDISVAAKHGKNVVEFKLSVVLDLKAKMRLYFFASLLFQMLPQAIFALSIHPAHIIGLSFVGIFLAGFIPVSTRAQLALITLTTLSFVTIMILRAPFEFKFVIYNAAFAGLAAIITGSSALSRDFSERANFLLQRKTDELLFNTLPPAIADDLRRSPSGQDKFTKRYDDVTVMFVDIVGFTGFCISNSPETVVSHLDHIFRRIDAICDQTGIEKIKTIGDAYLAAAGIPHPVIDHTERVIESAFEIREAVRKISHLTQIELDVRIGIHRGPVVAGIIGKNKLQFDLWGDTVNIASRLEAHGKAGKIYVSTEVRNHVEFACEFGERTMLKLKGVGDFPVFELIRPKIASSRT